MEDREIPPFLAAERDAVLAEIHEAFSGVSREGGVSWSEAQVLDFYGSPEEQAAARARDRDTRWEELTEDPDWKPEVVFGGFSFLDAIGFRYYLPAAMVYTVRGSWDSEFSFHLTLREDELRDYSQSRWTLFDLRQRLCIQRFLQYMGIFSAWHLSKGGENDWFGALNSYWGRLPDETDDPSPKP